MMRPGDGPPVEWTIGEAFRLRSGDLICGDLMPYGGAAFAVVKEMLHSRFVVIGEAVKVVASYEADGPRSQVLDFDPTYLIPMKSRHVLSEYEFVRDTTIQMEKVYNHSDTVITVKHGWLTVNESPDRKLDVVPWVVDAAGNSVRLPSRHWERRGFDATLTRRRADVEAVLDEMAAAIR